MRFFRMDRWYWPLLGVVTLLGIVLTGVADFGIVIRSHIWALSLGTIARSLGEALAIAVLLAIVVDRRVKTDLTREVAEKTAEATAEVFFREFLGGHKLPDEYYNEMRKLAATDLLSYRGRWELCLDWTDNKTYVQVTSTLHSSLENLSSEPVPVGDVWLLNYQDGRPTSRLMRYEGVLSAPASEPGHARIVTRVVLTRTDMDQMNKAARFEPLRVYLSLPSSPVVSPGAEYSYMAEGITYHHSSSMIPLLFRYPTLDQTLSVSGSALLDLNFDVYQGWRQLTPCQEVGEASNRVFMYEAAGLAIGGSTIRVQWALKTGANNVEPFTLQRPASLPEA